MIKLKIWLYNWLAKDLGKLGREGDTELAHVNTWEANLLKAHGGSGTINPVTGLREFKGGGGGSTTETTQNIDPAILPYITYGLDEAKGLYNQSGPDYYGGDTYVPASTQTTDALSMAEARARTGSPLLPAAESQALSTISGDRLSAGNPYFSAMMANAAAPVVREFNDAMGNISSKSAMSGRYGSNAQARMEYDASRNLAESLAAKSAELAYSNYGAERARQDTAIANAGNLAAQGYTDMNQLAKIGQTNEQYAKDKLNADIARFEFNQNKPYNKLESYLSAAYGAPAPVNQTSVSSVGGK